MLDQMLTLDYKKRPMAKELLEHPFFTDAPDIPKPKERRRPPPPPVRTGS